MIVVPQGEQRQDPRAIQGTSEEFRRMDLSDAFGMVGAELLVKGSDVVRKMAEREDKILREEATLQLNADLAAFDLDNERRVRELSEQYPGRGLTARVMEDFNERKQAIVDAQPNFLKTPAQTQLLTAQVRQAKSAIGVENDQVAAQNEARAQTFRDSLTNSVRFGRMSEEDALRKVQSFIGSLPANKRQAALNNLTEAIRAASLENLMERDYNAGLAAIKEGQYDDLSPSRLEAIYKQGLRQRADSNVSVEKLDKIIVQNRTTDPVTAAAASLRKQGVEQPTREQLRSEQQALGLPAKQIATLTKAEAQEATMQFANVQSVDDFKQVKQAQANAWVSQGIDPEAAVKDMVRFAKAPAVLKGAMVAPQNAPASYYQSVIDLMQDPQAGEKARQSLKEGVESGGYLFKTDYNKFSEYLAAEERKRLDVLLRSGMFQSEAQPIVKAFADTTSLMASYEVASNRGVMPSEDTLKRLVEESSGTTIVNNGLNAVVMPTILADVYADKIDDLKETVVRNGLVEIPQGYPSTETGQNEVIEDSGWAMDGMEGMVLKMGRQPLTYKGTNNPVRLSFDRMTAYLASNRKSLEDLQDLLVFESGTPPRPDVITGAPIEFPGTLEELRAFTGTGVE